MLFLHSTFGQIMNSFFKTHYNCNLLWKPLSDFPAELISQNGNPEGFHCTLDNISASEIQYFTEFFICMPILSTELFLALFYQKLLPQGLSQSRYSINVRCMTKCRVDEWRTLRNRRLGALRMLS